MASEIRVNKIENRSGLGTVTFADTGVDLAGIVTATTFSGSGASLTALPAAQVTGTLPAISGANLTNLTATNLTGTIADARFPATLPAASAANLTSIPAANIVGVCTSGLTKTGGFGGTNTPAFSVYRSGTQAIANSTATKVQYNTESFDTDNTFDSSTNYRYTPAFSGKSFLVGSIRLYGTDDFNNYTLEIYKNGTAILRQQNSHWHYESAQVSGIVTHDTDDYFEVFVTQQSGSSLDVMSGIEITYFMGYKLIE